MEAVIFSSKIDAWPLVFYAGIIGCVAFVVSKAMLVIADKRARRHLFGITAACAAPAVLLPAWIFLDTNYVLDAGRLTINSGPFVWEIPVASIRSVTPSRSYRSSPALSMDRMMISYGEDQRVMISPADKDGFLAELEKRR